MNLNFLDNKKIGILGLGLENQALIKYLLKHEVKCEITICDARDKKELGEKYDELNNSVETHGNASVHWQLGKNFNKNLEKFDILFRSPGWPIDCSGIQRALEIKSPLPLPARASQWQAGPFVKGGRILSSPMKLFFELCPSKNIIGVTGTKGKGTTASLIYEILKKHFSAETHGRASVHLGGNIGVAPFSFIDKIKKNDWVVLELSSFQLEDLAVSPHIAVIINLYPEHLAPADPNNPNYHKSLIAYRDAKFNIVKWQGSRDKAVLNYELGIMNYGLKSQVLTFSGKNSRAGCYWLDENRLKFHNSSFIIHTSLLGEHNKENIAAAVAAAKIVGVKDEIIKKAVANFKGLPHRLELAREYQGVKYYDDSFATTPESTIIALKSFAAPATPSLLGGQAAPIILLLGGADKGADFKKLAEETKRRADFVVLLKGDATFRIEKELLKIGFKKDKMKLASNIKEAVIMACGQAGRGDIVLLSTACASFGMFKNYKERGDLFKKEVSKLK